MSEVRTETPPDREANGREGSPPATHSRKPSAQPGKRRRKRSTDDKSEESEGEAGLPALAAASLGSPCEGASRNGSGRRLSLHEALPDVCDPRYGMWGERPAHSPPQRDVRSGGSYESVQLPGSIMDDTQPLASADILQSKYDKYNDPFKVQKATDEKQVRKTVETLFFRDNKRKIDFVLVYKDDEDDERAERRRVFEHNLREEGLELETEDKKQSQDGLTYFVKIHAPWDLLVRYAEIMKLKKPIKRFIIIRGGEVWKDDTEKKKKNDFFSWMGMKNPFMYDEKLIPPEPTYFSTGFSRSHVEQFIIKDRETFFTPSQRSQIVWEILLRVRYNNSDQEIYKKWRLGISRLLSNDTYVAAFPLHDGRYDKDGPDGAICDRRLLYLEWAQFKKWYKIQPLHVIRRYFGDKMAMYFAWLGFYTQMLIPASLFGIFTFTCGVFIMFSDFNQPSEEICSNNTEASSIIMCPLCDRLCDFWKLGDSCANAYITFLFDNPATVFFSIAMSFWATMFLELWKRKQSVIQWQWDLENYEEEEELRPEYEEKVTTTRINPVTNKPEPYMPLTDKLSRYVASYSVILVMLFVMLASVFSVIVYRIAVGLAIYQTDSDFIRRNAKLATSITAAFINLMLIIVFNFVYEKLVAWLTSLEVPRTETEYEDSFTLKMFIFQFINYYASLIYIAFFKGRFLYHPGDIEVRRNIFAKARYDMCDSAGCFFDLCVQLIIIMLGKQFFNNIIEIFWPILRVWWNKRTGHDNQLSEAYTRWEQDYDLAPYTRLSLFNEYLEMVIQYGFVTMFVAAFPLAPFFALINNFIEIRLDAFKYLTQCRRPRAERIQDIGIWYSILKGITYFSVVTNALVISYTSDFIPRLVYIYQYSGSTNLVGYVKNSLSAFNTSQYTSEMGPENRTGWPELCYYKAYRNGPADENPYDLNQQFWHVAAARLAFIIIFEHIVFCLTSAVAMAIPDIPVEVRNQMLREKKVEKETLFENEMKKIRHERQVRRDRMSSPEEDNLDIDLGEGLQTRRNSRVATPTLSSGLFHDHNS